MATTSDNPFPTADQPYAGSNVGVDNGASGGRGDAVNRVVQGAHEAVDRLADKAGPAIERMRSGVSTMSDSMHEKAEQFGAWEEQWVEGCRQTVREHPLATVAVAVAAGVLLSKLLSSR